MNDVFLTLITYHISLHKLINCYIFLAGDEFCCVLQVDNNRLFMKCNDHNIDK